MNSTDKSRPNTPDEVFTVRGRPVAYFDTHWGGEVRAIERGPFPVSPTGYRSLCCGPGTPRPTQEVLDHLALNLERKNEALLRNCRRALVRPHGAALARYIHISGEAQTATEHGFFAPDDKRLALWQHAYRLYSAIAENRTLQPRPCHPHGGAWDTGQCARAIATTRKIIPWLAQLIAGELSVFPKTPNDLGAHFYTARAYLELPPRLTPEPVNTVPAIPRDFAFTAELTADQAGNEEDNDEREKYPAKPDTPGRESIDAASPDNADGQKLAQLELF